MAALQASALYGGEWLASCPSRSDPGEISPTIRRMGSWFRSVAGLNVLEKR
jgi:hypothetical protein